MRLMNENIASDNSGTVTLLPEEPEDMVRTSPLPLPQTMSLTYSSGMRITS